MNATGLPIPTSTTAPTAPAAEPFASPASGQGATGFVLALAQMLGSSLPPSAAQTELAAASTKGAEDAGAGDPTAAALALLPLPMGQMLPPAPLGAEQGDPLEMLGLSSRAEGASARDAALLQALTERLASVDEPSGDAPLQSGALGALESTPPRATTIEATAHARSLQQPVGTQAWADELGSRLTMMTEKGQHTASLRLSPEHLGPLEIRIAMRDDQASVWFGAAHADTRAAIEHALPRLRELFEAQGMSLADAGVFREPPKQSPTEWRGLANDANEPAASTEDTASVSRVQVGLVDAFA